jgi:arylsulfatase A-like enzyme/Flp pilus assembly protein TadD
MRAVWTTRAAVITLGAIVLASAAWFWQASRRSGPELDLKGANVLLVTIDTLRVNRIGAYGNGSGLTPALDALASSGVRFEQAWSHVPITLPAHASILTGLIPPNHGVRNNSAFRLGAEPTTLAERLRQAGYRTGAFVGAFVLDSRFGLDRGFDEYDDRYRPGGAAASFHFVERAADDVLRAATQWITQPEPGPWFAWVHLFDPHAPYRAPPAFQTGREPYDAEVAWTDSAIGSALDGLRRAGQLDRTLVIVTADHGESLGQHGETTHGLFAYDATLRIPLIVSAPGLDSRVVSAPASHIDIFPTVLDLVGESPGTTDGRSLRSALEGVDLPGSAAIYFETLDANLTRGWAPLKGVVSEGWKYIDLPEPELYRLDVDPEEHTNLMAREPGRAAALQRHLAQWRTTTATVARSVVDSATAARLQSLGYISSTASSRATYTLADDPKRLVALSELFNDALDDHSRGHSDVALEKFSKVLAERPDFLAARLSAASVLIDSGRGAAAVGLLRETPPADQNGSAWLTRMGQALAGTGRLHEARSLLESAVTMANDSEPLNDLGVVLLRLGKADEARRRFEQLLNVDPTATGTWYNLGLLELSVRRATAAAAAFDHVVQLDPTHADGWRGLGASVAADDSARAVAAWQRVMALDPNDFDTLYNLGMTLSESGRRTEAPAYLRRFLAEAPRDRYAKDFSRVRAVLARLESAQ